MNVTIGLRGSARDLQLELEMTEDALFDAVKAATADDADPLDVTDAKGQRAIIPGDAIAYVLVAPEEKRRVGFAL